MWERKKKRSWRPGTLFRRTHNLRTQLQYRGFFLLSLRFLSLCLKKASHIFSWGLRLCLIRPWISCCIALSAKMVQWWEDIATGSSKMGQGLKIVWYLTFLTSVYFSRESWKQITQVINKSQRRRSTFLHSWSITEHFCNIFTLWFTLATEHSLQIVFFFHKIH